MKSAPPIHVRKRSENLKTILHIPGRKVYHDAISIAMFGEGKTNREVAFIRMLEKDGEWSLRLVNFFILCILFMTFYDLGNGNINIFSNYVVCYVPAFHNGSFTYRQSFQIISDKHLQTYKDYSTEQYCKIKDINYTDLYERNNGKFDQIIKDERVTNYTKSRGCKYLLANQHLDIIYQQKFYCETAYLARYWRIAPELGKLCSMILCGTLADLYGRQPVLIVCSLIFAISSICMHIPNVYSMFVCKFFYGLGGFNGQFIVIIIFLESCSPKMRRIMGFFLFHSTPIVWLWDCFHIFFVKHKLYGYMISTMITLIALISILIINESLRWLCVSGQEEVVWKILDEECFYQWIFYQHRKSIKNHFQLYLKPIFRTRMIIALLVYALIVVVSNSTDPVMKKVTTRSNAIIYSIIYGCMQPIVLYTVFMMQIKTSLRTCLMTCNCLILWLNTAIYIQIAEMPTNALIVALVTLAFCNANYMVMILYAVKLFPTTHRATTLGILHTVQSMSSVVHLSLRNRITTMDDAYSHLPSLLCSAIIMFLMAILPNLVAYELPDKPVEALHGQVVK